LSRYPNSQQSGLMENCLQNFLGVSRVEMRALNSSIECVIDRLSFQRVVQIFSSTFWASLVSSAVDKWVVRDPLSRPPHGFTVDIG